MTDTSVLEIALQAILVAGKLCAPILLVTLAVGFFISLLQSVTQIQEQTLTFVPKLGAVALVILLAGHWMLAEMVSFTTAMYDMLQGLVNGA